jgi:dolichol-phosphate mannosyltransferase
MTETNRPLLSIIIPLYNEELVIDEMHGRIAGVLNGLNVESEVILVNDGSSDGTCFLAKKICDSDARFKLISFSRNFGHQIAITAGMEKSMGRAVVVIDADLQDPPELISEMMKKWEEGFHVVYGVRKIRKGESLFKRATAALFYRVLRLMTNAEIPVDAGDFRLLDRKVVEQLKNMRERSRFLRGMVSWVGFKQCKLEYVRERRFAGDTKYPLKKMLAFAIDGMLSFSRVPLRLSTLLGFICACFSFIFILYGFIIKSFFPAYAIPGWASIFIASLFLGGVQLICLGILGEYIGRIYEEVKKRPLYIIDEEVNFK